MAARGDPDEVLEVLPPKVMHPAERPAKDQLNWLASGRPQARWDVGARCSL